MTITLTGIELERMDAILEQFEYLLRRVAGLDNNSKINDYLECIRKQEIIRFEFYGVPHGTKKAKQALYIEVDWAKHTSLRSSNPYIAIPSYWGDGDNKKVNPDIRDEAQQFMKKCVGLSIEWNFTYATNDLVEPLNKKLGTHQTRPDEVITPPDGNFSGYSIIDLEEMSVKTNR